MRTYDLAIPNVFGKLHTKSEDLSGKLGIWSLGVTKGYLESNFNMEDMGEVAFII